MKKKISLINGTFSDFISVYDRGLLFGDGFFETMKWITVNGKKKVVFWSRHIDRLKKSCNKAKIKCPSKRMLDEYKNTIFKKCAQFNQFKGVLKIIITRGEGGRGYSFEKNMKPSVIFQSFPITLPDEKSLLEGVEVDICKTSINQNNFLSGLKHLNRIDSVLASDDIKKKIYDLIFLDSNNLIIEGIKTNIFFIKKKKLITPKISSSGINGIMRQIVIEKYSSLYEELFESNINVNQISEFDGAFLTNSIIGILPIKNIKKTGFVIDDKITKLRKLIEESEITED